MKNLCYKCRHYVPDKRDKYMGTCDIDGKTLCEYTRRPPLSYGCKRHFSPIENEKEGGKL